MTFPFRMASGVLCFVLAACSSKSTTPVTLPPTRPFLEFQPAAVQMLHVIAQTKNLGRDWWVRLEVAWKPEAVIEVQIDKKGPGPGDFTLEADGLNCVMANSQKPYLKGAYVEMVRTGDEVHFDVTFPNRDERDRLQASEWLRTVEAKRKP